MPSFAIKTPQRTYCAIVERGILERTAQFVPGNAGKVFVISTKDVWEHHGETLQRGLAELSYETLFFPGGEERKRLARIEALAAEMVERGGDRSSIVIAFGGGIVNDMAGFLAAIFMRGIPVVQVPTTLLAQVDAAIGGKTGVNLIEGKNLIGSFHQPLATLIDPSVLSTLPEREYRAGLFEVIKYGVIRSAPLFRVLSEGSDEVLAREPDVLDRIIADSVCIKAEVVSADERESGLRRILNFGHTFGHALEAETDYELFLHGEAVAFGMRAAVNLAHAIGDLSAEDSGDILHTIRRYGPIPSSRHITARSLFARLARDKKTLQGKVHFVLPVKIGEVRISSSVEEKMVLRAIESALSE